MADYVNPENPVPPNLQEVQVLNDFVKTLLVSQTVIITNHQIEKFQEKNLQLTSLLSPLWKRLEDVRNGSSEAVEVSVICYIDRANHTSAWHPHFCITINLVCTSIRWYVGMSRIEGDNITRQNQVIETKTEMFDFKTKRVQVPESSATHVQHQMVNTSFTIQKEVSITSNSELVPLIKIATLEHVHQIIRKLFTKTIAHVPLAGRLAYLTASLEKIGQDQEILSTVKGYEIPFVSLPYQEKVPNLTKMSKE